MAGRIRRILDQSGQLPFSRLFDLVDEPRALCYLAPGWLAREGKLDFLQQGGRRTVTLRRN